MAKLSARGRKEIVRLEKTVRVIEGDGTTIIRRWTLALMDDQNILEKLDVTRNGDKMTFGWKVKSKLKPEATTDQFTAAYEKAGWVRVV